MSKDCITRNLDAAKDWKKIPYYKERINVLKQFIGKDKPSIDLGGGGFIPKVLKVTHTCDNNNLAGELLKKEKYKGEFKVVNLQRELPYSDKQFKVAICSEVIEHFRKDKYVTEFFNEINRISEKWLITTPSKIFLDPDHYFFFFPNDLYKLIKLPRESFIIYKKHPYYYISNDIERIGEILNGKK